MCGGQQVKRQCLKTDSKAMEKIMGRNKKKKEEFEVNADEISDTGAEGVEVVAIDGDAENTKPAEISEHIDEINRIFFNPIGLVLVPGDGDTFTVQDVLSPGTHPTVDAGAKKYMEKVKSFQSFCAPRRKQREKVLGYGKQPIK
jgi:hypothetical protein